ncbi:hypothetical protein DFR58_11786 [Anaerobacterium chartisolvens]|uniref:Uncharacterized protein n=1 Tax=Anaerobacterium chartisolvens TaxID=1297424 RepID=A0A369AZD6_9FIRM|nr:hypothetical protein [Anaerobacterium chartisolvens]RCX13546.1 hypothetical protein DFR58_11786 [Anaerobacterium chartisolvens]
MDEKINNISEDGNKYNPEKKDRNFYSAEGILERDNKPENFKKFTMGKNGKIWSAEGYASSISTFQIFIILGWVNAAFTAFISPLFAVIGIIFGVITNRKWPGKGNAVIITNIVLAAINVLFGLFTIGLGIAAMHTY